MQSTISNQMNNQLYLTIQLNSTSIFNSNLPRYSTSIPSMRTNAILFTYLNYMRLHALGTHKLMLMVAAVKSIIYLPQKVDDFHKFTFQSLLANFINCVIDVIESLLQFPSRKFFSISRSELASISFYWVLTCISSIYKNFGTATAGVYYIVYNNISIY